MRALPPLLVALTLVGAACADDAPSASPRVTGSSDGRADTTLDGRTDERDRSGSGIFLRALVPFADCNAFLDHVRAEARERVGPYGLGGGPMYGLDDVAFAEAAVDDAGGAPLPATGDGDASSSAGYTGTNVQEVGVDEPDIVKTDGTRILAISAGVLTYVDLTTGTPTVTDRLSLPEGWDHELFVSGDRAFVFTNGGQWGAPMPVEPTPDDARPDDGIAPPGGWGPSAVILEIDLSDPGAMSVAASMRIEGQYLSARAIGDAVRLAVSSGPQQLPWVYPQTPAGEELATETNRRIVDESTLADWIPEFHLTTDDRDDQGPMLGCGRLHHPVEFSGFDVISVIDLSLASGLDEGFAARDAVGVLAGGQTVYSSTERFYVATTKWAGADLADDAQLQEWSEDYETDLHAFAISPDRPTEYVASGTIAGSLLNRFSLDEHDGYLRAIATDGSPWDRSNESETRLVVLEEQGDVLAPVGEVGGLGRGERLYSARLLDDVGFAVTFRQVDPFYVLDLRDPRNPKVTGELKIPGFSTYLHPVGDHRVLGVGQDATEDGAVLGLKLSLFDVSDPASPREVAVWTMRDASSPVEYDHRAFQIRGTTAIVPVQSWSTEFNGAILFDLSDGITEIGRISHVGDAAPPQSDCRTVSPEEFGQESELAWMALDGHIQVCDANDVGGWGTWYCDAIPATDLRSWFRDEVDVEAQLSAIGIDEDDDRIEICWPDDVYRESIQRSLVIEDEVWTMTPSALQANQLDSLAVTARLPLR
jgi:hypothetical protein